MNKTLIIADDDLNCAKNILNSFKESNKKTDILGLATNGEETLIMIKKYKPDFLVLDLNMPKKTGIEVIKEIEKSGIYQTKIIVISGECELVNELNLMKHKSISNIFIKPFKASILCESIEEENGSTSNKELELYIDDILHNFTFNFTSQSYEYLKKCIRKAIYSPFVLKKIYQEIAIEEDTNANNVKWRVQKLILSMNRYTSKSIIEKYIPYDPNPSAKIFICEISKKVRKEIENKRFA